MPWTPELGGKTIALMEAAAKRFRLNNASLSIFDERHEILKVEVGYNLMTLERTTSISAHALYSEDVFVILDTHRVCYSNFLLHINPNANNGLGLAFCEKSMGHWSTSYPFFCRSTSDLGLW